MILAKAGGAEKTVKRLQDVSTSFHCVKVKPEHCHLELVMLFSVRAAQIYNHTPLTQSQTGLSCQSCLIPALTIYKLLNIGKSLSF